MTQKLEWLSDNVGMIRLVRPSYNDKRMKGIAFRIRPVRESEKLSAKDILLLIIVISRLTK
jgi:hypothetical protein